jgi:cytochrome c biogenesis protein CcdA
MFIATVGFAVGLDGDVFRTVSAILLVMLGAALLSTAFQVRLSVAAGGLTNAADRMIRRLSLASGKGQFIVGGLLGLVWSPCAGPTLGAASLLAAERKDLGSVASVMFAFGLGTTLPMVVVALLSRKALLRWRQRMLAAGQVGKIAMGLSALAIGGLILTGFDRSVETALVSSSPEWLTNLTTQF